MRNSVLIIGQGLAGSCLALQLLSRGLDVQVIADTDAPCSTLGAAGLINPVNPRHRALTRWGADLLPYSHRFYTDAETELEGKFFFPLPMFAIHGSQRAANEWSAASSASLSGWIEDGQWQHPQVISPYGTGLIRMAGWLDLEKFTAQTREYLRKRDRFTEGTVDAESLKNNSGPCAGFDAVVWCTGLGLQALPGFADDLFRPVKGEWLELYIPGLQLEELLHYGNFMIPLGNDHYRIGATYNWNQLDHLPTDEAKEQLLGKLATVIRPELPVSVIRHVAGIRPATRTRLPIIGKIPGPGNRYVFNGLGSKGGILAPYWSEQLTNLITDDQPLPDEMNWWLA